MVADPRGPKHEQRPGARGRGRGPDGGSVCPYFSRFHSVALGVTQCRNCFGNSELTDSYRLLPFRDVSLNLSRKVIAAGILHW